MKKINLNRDFRVPSALDLSAPKIDNVLLVGSCISMILQDHFKLHHNAKSTNIHINNINDSKEFVSTENFDFTVVSFPVDNILLKKDFFFQDLNNEVLALRRFEEAKNILSRLFLKVTKHISNLKCPIFVIGFLVPQQNHLGRLMGRYIYANPQFFFEELNKYLYELLSNFKNIYFIDADSIASTYGKSTIQDDLIWSITHGGILSNLDFDIEKNLKDLGHVRVEPSKHITEYYNENRELFWGALLEEIYGAFKTLRDDKPIKVLITDLDDTLWRTVVAEGITDESEYLFQGIPFGYFEALNFAKARGIVLAICSKNDEAVIEKFWSKKLRWFFDYNNFVVKKINWKSKVDNIRDIALQLNVGLDSILFVDDNPREREHVLSELPDIRVIGDNFYDVRRLILWSPSLQRPYITEESSRKTMMMQQMIARNLAIEESSGVEHLQRLGLLLSIAKIDSTEHRNFARCIELINKTNQFNTTGIRYSLESISDVFESGGAIYCASASDVHSDYGIVIVSIVYQRRVEIMVMSCRVFGLSLEYAFLKSLIEISSHSLTDCLEISFSKTDRNSVAQSLINEFQSTMNDDGIVNVSIKDVNSKCEYVTVKFE